MGDVGRGGERRSLQPVDEKSGLNSDTTSSEPEYISFRHMVFYDRLSSNNSARIRMWLYCRRGIEDKIHVVRVTHEEQLTDDFRAINPLGKIPLLTVGQLNIAGSPSTNPSSRGGVRGRPDCLHGASKRQQAGGEWLAEAAVILNFLEREYMRSQSAPHSFIPVDPLKQARMELVIRTHDLYLASPNCTQPGFSHTQGCMYLAPPGSTRDTHRQISRRDRAAKVREVWHQLDILESFLRSPFFMGSQKTLADFTVYPTIVFFTFLGPRVLGWDDGAVFYRRPKLKEWFYEHMKDQASDRVRGELVESLRKKEISGDLEEVIAETKDKTFKWQYP